ncbi:MAG: OmpA family protein, partial [Saprospiraceae bacterium]
AWNTPPLNLGPTINNHEDQGALTVAIDGYTTILTLQQVNMRNELLSSDLATVNLPEQVTAAACIFIQGKVMKSKDDKHIPNAILVFTAEGIENGSDTILSDEEGDFLVVLPKNQVYQLYCNATGFDFFADRITTFEDAKNKINFDIHLDEVVAKDLGANSKPIILKNVLFEFASYTLEVGSFVELDQLFLFLQSNPDLSVAIYGHTDNAGDKLNNQLLSENRARAVYNYLVNKGLPADRLSIKGFGDSSPIATNDTEEGKAMNRRVEIKLSSIKP